MYLGSHYRGLGDAEATQRAGMLSTQSFAAVAGSFTPQIASLVSLSVPVVGAAIAGITLALTAIFSRKGPKQKELATQAVNQVSALMEQNLAEYMAGPRTRESQTVALANFDAAWAWLISDQGCGNPQLGDAGRRCIEERQRGGVAPWCPTGTGCDYFVTLRDPIANDPRPAELEAASAALPAEVQNLGVPLPGGGSLNVLALAGLALVAWGLTR